MRGAHVRVICGVAVAAAAASVATVVAVDAASQGGAARAVAAPTTTTAPAPTPTVATTTTLPPPPPSKSAAAPLRDLQEGDKGADVLALEERLAELGYRPGVLDGGFDGDLASAVLAFQKHEGLERDRIVTVDVRLALAAPAGAGPEAGLPVPRVEIDKERQIAFVVLDSGITILNVSTGNEEYYQAPSGGTGFARTPVGEYSVVSRIDGVRHAPLGTLYRPLYFHGGYAIHGSMSVPEYPASHGCVRVSYPDMDWLFPTIDNGTPVYVYDIENPLPPPEIRVGPVPTYS